MQRDLESVYICKHIVSEFNEKLIKNNIDTRLLLHFVNVYIYELIN